MISWLAPTENDDGTRSRISRAIASATGNRAACITRSSLSTPGLATYVINGLAAGTYYLVLSVWIQERRKRIFERGAGEPVIDWRPQGDSNPGYRRERAMS